VKGLGVHSFPSNGVGTDVQAASFFAGKHYKTVTVDWGEDIRVASPPKRFTSRGIWNLIGPRSILLTIGSNSMGRVHSRCIWHDIVVPKGARGCVVFTVAGILL